MDTADMSRWRTFAIADHDFIVCSSAFSNTVIVIAANRKIYDVVGPTKAELLVELDWQPRAFDRETGLVMAGEGGRGAYLLGVPPY